MNEILETYARQYLKDGLAKCNETQQLLFKRMYSHHGITKPINKIVDFMEVSQLDTAMMQVKRTLDKKEKK